MAAVCRRHVVYIPGVCWCMVKSPWANTAPLQQVIIILYKFTATAGTYVDRMEG